MQISFFDLKATCSICNNEVGLNRFKIKKSNSWICPKCFKKIGNINLYKVTVDEIKEIIFKIENQIKNRNNKIINDPLYTAEGMYKYCLENNSGSGFNEKLGIKHFKILEDNLLNGKEIKTVFIGLHNYISNSQYNGNFAYTITNKRIILGQKQNLSGENFQAISLNNINDIAFKSGILFGIITIDTIKETFNIALDKNSAKLINTKIHEVIEETKNIPIQFHQQANTNLSLADEIKKYKELLDIGALTQEEFNAKKNQLLNL